MHSKKINWKQAIIHYYSAPQATVFYQFRLGLGLFLCGLVAVVMANQLLLPSLKQEVLVLLGLIVGGIGFIMAMLAQTRMMIGRLLHFWRRK